MLRSLSEMRGYSILATDGHIGKAHDFLFDSLTWTLRYLVVKTGPWLLERRVLISPVALGDPDWTKREFPVNLTRDQVKSAPEIDLDKPVSLQRQVDLHTHHRWPLYMPAPLVGGGGVPPAAPVIPMGEPESQEKVKERGDPDLRSHREVTGYHISAIDGEIGHVEDFIADDSQWCLRHMVIDTRNWLPGRKVLIPTDWVEDVDWEERTVHVSLDRETIRSSPEFDPSLPVSPEHDKQLRDHCGRSQG
ncbi:PRC-barrel domain containing protein [Candidatus Sumerlaeota bacterium]|nr:PRC-barrel domain containing protein [Candidatus Sumerlaeota bacterium]